MTAAPDDVAGYVLATCDIRQARLDRAVAGGLRVDVEPGIGYVAAECNPDHARAAIALWRGVAERHGTNSSSRRRPVCPTCLVESPCPDLLAVVEACRAYAGGTP